MSFDPYINQAKSSFPYSDFTTVKESRYSCLMPWHHNDVQAAFRELPNITSFIDLTAHIGVDTIMLHYLYPKAIGISNEYDKDTFDKLQDNLCRYSRILKKPLSMMKAHQGDAVELVREGVTKVDLIYIDPPWGGEYKQKKMQLFLSGTNVAELIPSLLHPARTIVLKTPVNIDVSDYKNLKFRKYPITTGKKISYNLWFFC